MRRGGARARRWRRRRRAAARTAADVLEAVEVHDRVDDDRRERLLGERRRREHEDRVPVVDGLQPRVYDVRVRRRRRRGRSAPRSRRSARRGTSPRCRGTSPAEGAAGTSALAGAEGGRVGVELCGGARAPCVAAAHLERELRGDGERRGELRLAGAVLAVELGERARLDAAARMSSSSFEPVVMRKTVSCRVFWRSSPDLNASLLGHTLFAASPIFATFASERPLTSVSFRFDVIRICSTVAKPASESFLMSACCTPTFCSAFSGVNGTSSTSSSGGAGTARACARWWRPSVRVGSVRRADGGRWDVSRGAKR